MLFNSFVFAALLCVTFALFWALPWQRARLVVLLVASFVFYAWSHPPSALLLLATIGVNYGLARAQEARRSKGLLAVTVALNLSVLAWFKYAAFATEQWNALFGTWAHVDPPSRFLPLGISFFTFQIVAYQADVYRGTIAAERSLLVFAVFKSFFAQLIAGPIVRAKEFLPQLHTRARFDVDRTARGVFLVLVGLSLKTGIADVLAQFADDGFKRVPAITTNEAWLSLFAYGFQLFTDFWGYSTVAVGVGLLFGLELPMNFDAPYTADSLQGFWRRWHVTLSFWFRDYLYVPLGGNRAHHARNLLVTMSLAGLWHGAAWSFVFWGFFHGLWQVLESKTKKKLGRVGTFLGVMLLWVLFRAPSLTVALAYYGRLLLPPYTWSPRISEILVIWLLFVLLLAPRLNRALREPTPRLGWTLALAILALGYASAHYDFIYFKF